MKKLRMRIGDLRVESFEPVGERSAKRGTVRGMEPLGESEEGHSWCCYTVYVDESCPDTCEHTVCDCSGETCGSSCFICLSHPATCPPQSLCVDTCVC